MGSPGWKYRQTSTKTGEVETNSGLLIVIEYITDEPVFYFGTRIHEEALRSYIYYKIVERKSSVPANEKARVTNTTTKTKLGSATRRRSPEDNS